MFLIRSVGHSLRQIFQKLLTLRNRRKYIFSDLAVSGCSKQVFLISVCAVHIHVWWLCICGWCRCTFLCWPVCCVLSCMCLCACLHMLLKSNRSKWIDHFCTIQRQWKFESHSWLVVPEKLLYKYILYKYYSNLQTC